MQVRHNKEFICHFSSTGTCSAASRQAGPQHTWQLLGKTKTITLNTPPSSFFPPAFPAEHNVTQSGILHPLVSCILSQPLVQPQPSHQWGRVGKRKGLGAELTLPIPGKTTCVFNACLVKKPKHSIIQTAVKKINSILAEPRTQSILILYSSRLRLNLLRLLKICS